MGWLPKKHVSFLSHFQFQRISLLYIVHLFCINKQLSDTGSIYKESNAHCSFLGPGQPVLQTRQMTFIAWACVCMPCYMFMLLQLERKIET